MIKRICLLIILALLPILMTHQNVALASAQSEIKSGISSTNNGNEPTGDLNSTITTVINLLSVAVGVVAVVMIIVAGYKYITSAGVAEKTKSAKNALLYAIVGLVIVALAQTIAHFVLTQASK